MRARRGTSSVCSHGDLRGWTHTAIQRSSRDKALLAALSADERDTVLWVVENYPTLSVTQALEHCRLSGM
jgi:hypothetical protein